jgi:hypothetical protein
MIARGWRWACVALALALSTSSCSSDDSTPANGGSGGSGGGSATGGSGGAGGDPTPSTSCVRPGDKGNDKGVGEYCTPAGGECNGFPESGLCLASVGQDQWMCTRVGCDSNTDCGQGAGCLIVPGQGSACVPCRCDSGGVGCSDAGTDAGSGGTAGAAGADGG